MAQTWGLLTNHALVLIYVTKHSASTVRAISEGVGVTERATLSILRELDAGGIVGRRREGRRNTYSVAFDRLAAYRRQGTVALTPREFVDGLIGTLLSVSDDARDDEGVFRALPDSGAQEPRLGTWGFFTNHALLLLSIAIDHSATVREMAMSVGITERAVVAIAQQLEEDGIIVRRRIGRRNEYEIDFDALRQFPRWSPEEWKIPDELIDVAVKGLELLVMRSASQI
jgi:DNA-binding Lrp family transcriptional regulator